MTPFADGLVFPESPRWHDGALWAVDMWGHTVLRFGADGAAEVVHRFDDDEDPGGIGWLPDGSLLVVGMEGRVVYRISDGVATVHADGRTLYVAEPGAARLSAFRLGPDGPADRTEIPLEPAEGAPYVAPDGICLDADGGIWVADPMAHRVFRVADGRTTDVVETPGVHPTACVLGGPDRRTLYVTAAEEVSKAHRALGDTGRILAVDVAVGGVGTP